MLFLMTVKQILWLKKLALATNSQRNEAFNNVVWSKILKSGSTVEVTVMIFRLPVALVRQMKGEIVLAKL